jgi:hypothetical protein
MCPVLGDQLKRIVDEKLDKMKFLSWVMMTSKRIVT